MSDRSLSEILEAFLLVLVGDRSFRRKDNALILYERFYRLGPKFLFNALDLLGREPPDRIGIARIPPSRLGILNWIVSVSSFLIGVALRYGV
jgi:hypothetical protein